MEFHNIVSLKSTNESDVFIANIDITDINGDRGNCDFTVQPTDNYGLSPVVRGAVAQWIADGRPVNPPDPETLYVPRTISRRQFYQGLALAEIISKAEAISAISAGQIPHAMQTIVDGMEDEDDQFNASMLLIGATEFNRDHPLTMIFAITQDMSESDVDQFWITCSNL